MKILAYSIMVSLFFVSYQAWAEDSYDRTKPLLCASIEAISCEPGMPCEKDLPEVIGAPQFMRVDFSRKEIIGPNVQRRSG